MTVENYRLEHDLIGSLKVPAEAYMASKHSELLSFTRSMEKNLSRPTPTWLSLSFW